MVFRQERNIFQKLGSLNHHIYILSNMRHSVVSSRLTSFRRFSTQNYSSLYCVPCLRIRSVYAIIMNSGYGVQNQWNLKHIMKPSHDNYILSGRPDTRLPESILLHIPTFLMGGAWLRPS